MVNIGKYNKLRIVKFVDFGLYLDGDNGVEILLPRRYITDDWQIGDEIDVFIYNDSEDRLIATTEHPFATVGQFAFLQVSQVNSFGAFLDWGIPKEILVPFREQRVRMRQGGIYMVYLYLDNTTKRIVASSKVEKFIGNKFPDELRPGDKVAALVYSHGELGYKAVVNDLYYGMLYENELYRPLEIGVEIEAHVRRVREDGKIDLTIGGKAGERAETLAREIYDRIIAEGGRLSVGDKSSPEKISELFACSKKDFKKAVGKLYKEQLVNVGADFIEKR